MFDQPDGANVRSAIGSYVKVVTNTEWPLMRNGDESPAAWQGIDRVFAAMQAYTPGSASQSAFYDDSVRHLNAVLEARSDRLSASDGNDLPVLIAALIIVGAIVILGCATLVGPEALPSTQSAQRRLPSSSASRSSSSSLCSSRSPATSRSAPCRSRKGRWRQLPRSQSKTAHHRRGCSIRRGP